MNLSAALLLGALVAASPGALAAPAAQPAAAAPSGAQAMQGEWSILGPASMVHLPIMMEFAFQSAAPTAEDMTAAHLTALQQVQVLATRVLAEANPNDPELVKLRAMLAVMADARVIISPSTITAKSGDATDVLKYTVKSEDGLQVKVSTTAEDGAVREMIITLPGPGLLMMGREGEEESLVLRRAGQLAAVKAGPSAAVSGATGTHTVKGVRFEGVVAPAGRFVMGSPSSESGRDGDEAQVEVTLTRPYEVMKTEVTQGLYRAVTGRNPSGFSSCGDGCPVEGVSWLEAVSFANALSSAEGLTPAYRVSGGTVTWDRSADGWRLPTEAEWEYAARAGERTVYAGSDRVDEVGWYDGNSGDKTHPACGKRPNGWGLCDMTGNVWEWTWDWYAGSRSGGTDPAGPASGSRRVCRGGSWVFNALVARVELRGNRSPGGRAHDLGFRLVRSLDP